MVQRSPKLSACRFAFHIIMLHIQVWQTVHEEYLHPYHVQKLQHLEPGDLAQRVDLCNWIKAHPELLRTILCIDEASFTRDGNSSSQNLHMLSHGNPHQTRVPNFQRRFLVNV